MVGTSRMLPAAGMFCLLSLCCNSHEDVGSRQVEKDMAKNETLPWFAESAKERGIDFVFESGHRGRYLLPEIVAGGAALFDVDNDGDLDAYLVQGGSLAGKKLSGPANQLHRNRGDGHFEDVTAASGADDRGYGMGVATGDYDNDGDTDLYLTNVGANVLLQNDGEGRFSDVTASARVGDAGCGASAAFVDYDADGDLDLFASNYVGWSIAAELECASALGKLDYCLPSMYDAPTPDVLYRNQGDGTFDDVSADSGIRAARGNGLGVVCGDFDGDGRTDIFVANDGSMNHLWLNQGNGTLAEQALLRGCALDESGQVKAGMGVSAIDLDGNETLDLLVVNLRHETDSFYRNQGDYFVDATAAVGLAWGGYPFTRFGVGILDFDNDGFPDLYEVNGRVEQNNLKLFSGDPFAEPNLLFRGRPGSRFEEVVPRGGTAHPLVATSRAAAFGDVDNDGGVDVLVVNRDARAYLLYNIVSERGNWLAFRVLNQHGSDAIGARVSFEVGNEKKWREVRTAYSYLAANDPRPHFGLGAGTRVSGVAVRWPDGQRENFGAFAANQIITLQRGNGRAQVRD